MPDTLLELYRQHRTVQSKYAYFLLAAVGACLGYALTQTKEAPISVSQIPLGIAVLAWCASFYLGCRHIRHTELILYSNMQLLKAQHGNDPVAGRNPELAGIAASVYRESIERDGKGSATAARWQFRSLVFGVGAYVVWHVYEMWLRSSIT